MYLPLKYDEFIRLVNASAHTEKFGEYQPGMTGYIDVVTPAHDKQPKIVKR